MSTKEYRRQWYLANRERLISKALDRYYADPDKAKAYSLQWHRDHRERSREMSRKWKRDNPDKVKIQKLRRKALKRNAPGTCSAAQLAARIALYGWKCWVPGCSKPYEQIDHVIPLSKGGTNWPANLRPICEMHNKLKFNHHWRDFLNDL